MIIYGFFGYDYWWGNIDKILIIFKNMNNIFFYKIMCEIEVDVYL